MTSKIRAPGLGSKQVSGKVTAVSAAFKNDGQNLTVDLKGKNISDTHVNEIAKHLKANPLIRVLDLSSNKITDDGAQGIAKAVSETEV